MDDDEPQADDPAELISYLEWLLREPDPETDRRSVLGALGSAWLDLCVRDGDEAALATSLSYLEEAVSGLVDWPDHPDRYDWFYVLSQAHRLRAEVADRAAEQTTSIAWLVRLLAELPDDHEDRDAAVVELAEMYSVRYLDHWIAGSPDLAALSEQLVTDVESLVLGADADDRARSAFDAMVGLARLERYQHHQRADDLELGLHRLDRGVWALPRGATLVEHMIYVLAWAHIDRAEKLGWDRTELLNAVATARRALESTEDDDDRQALDEVIACAYSVLWEQYQDRSDLDAAIESWRAVAARDGQWYAARATAELLTGRGEATENLSDVDEAIAILRHLLTVDGAGPAGDLSIALATAMRKRFALTGDRHLLDAARDQLDRVADQAVTDDERVDWMVQALLTAEAAARHDNSLPHTDVPPSVEPLASLVERGHLLLATARPIEPNQRPRLALILLIGEQTAAGAAMAIPKLDRMAAAIDIVEGWIDPPEGLASDIEVLRATLRYAEIVAGGGSRVEMPMGPLIRMLQRAASPAQRRAASAVLGIFEHGQMTDTQSQPSLRTADARLRDSGDADLVLMADLNRALTAVLRRGPEATRPDWVALRDAVDAAPPSLFIEHWIRPLVVGMLRELDGDVLPADVPLPPPLPGMDPQLRLLAEQFMLSVRLIGVERRGSLSEIRRLAGEWEALSQRIEPDQLPARFGAAASSGGVQLLIARLDPSDRQAAETAVRQYREAVELAAGEHHPLWAQLAMPLAESLRLAGQDRAESLRLGLSALAAAARTVMLQNDIGDALALATDDRDRADQVLAWALADGDLATAVTALDASRGLVLAATSASRSVAERLAAAGHQDLAAEWRLTGGLGRDELSGLPLGALRVEDGTLPDALRAKVLAALDASPDGSATATVDQIQVALAATAADALVYLLAPSKRNPGMAVVVPRTGPPSIVDLPELHLDPAMPVGRYVASATRDLQAPISNRPVTLAGVAEWAGRAVLADLLPRLPAADGPPHVVLVPVGELALVPWHLGRTPGKRYAAEELVISYSPSARLFCDAARRPAVPVRSALIVGDPDGSLRFAGHEAQAIHRVFYPAGQFLGHSDGTREAVLNWIGRAGAGPLLLHFSCHGLVDTARPDQAALVLSRGQLSVRDLVDATRSAELVADQVFLAACHTNAITGTYDEAFSLASVFLATGATTVFGSLWAVPDEATSLLMFMLHHFLSAEGLPPARALHAAQLWMLNPDRQPPSTMPAELARYASRPDLADPIAWAAFTHLGR